MKKHKEVDTSAYLLLDDIGCRICVVWTTIPAEFRWPVSSDDDTADRLAREAFCTFHEALARLGTLRRVGILHDDGTVDPVVMKRLRAKGATIIGIGDEPADEPDEDEE